MTSTEGQARASFTLYFLPSEFSSGKVTLLKVLEGTGPGRLMGQAEKPLPEKKNPNNSKAVENLHHIYTSINVFSSPSAALGISL